MANEHSQSGLQGPKVWAASAMAGAVVGYLTSLVISLPVSDHPTIEAWMVLPFAGLLACIALMPFIANRFWHHHYPDIALFLGFMVAAFYIAEFRVAAPDHAMSYGMEKILHAGEEFISFIALVGGLYVVSGGILIEVKGRATPVANMAILAVGAVIANIVGTTGASMLLIRPFMRLNRGRLSPLHVVFFIFIVSNCGGCVTPIGDPPLYLGYLKGVPFEWTLLNLWMDWFFVVGSLLIAFLVADKWIGNFDPPADWVHGEQTKSGVSIRGWVGLVCLALMLVGVFIPPVLKAVAKIDGLMIGAAFQIAVAVASYMLAPKELLKGNDFTFGPVKEVGLLFAGIFLTMVPALGFLAAKSGSLGLNNTLAFYFGTGSLSGVLDNAPTYLSFLQVAFGEAEITPSGMHTFLGTARGQDTLNAISTGAVFFGAMTYIGNGPNFMVKAIAEASGVRMPGFFGYLGRSCLILLPVLVAHSLIMVR
jgi:Na+/H+ antiporter NhaD/arsenite permease-like protein